MHVYVFMCECVCVCAYDKMYKCGSLPMMLWVCSSEQEVGHLGVEAQHSDQHGLIQYPHIRTQLTLLKPLSTQIQYHQYKHHK
jgi:hypothetical protein